MHAEPGSILTLSRLVPCVATAISIVLVVRIATGETFESLLAEMPADFGRDERVSQVRDFLKSDVNSEERVRAFLYVARLYQSGGLKADRRIARGWFERCIRESKKGSDPWFKSHMSIMEGHRTPERQARLKECERYCKDVTQKVTIARSKIESLIIRGDAAAAKSEFEAIASIAKPTKARSGLSLSDEMGIYQELLHCASMIMSSIARDRSIDRKTRESTIREVSIAFPSKQIRLEEAAVIERMDRSSDTTRTSTSASSRSGLFYTVMAVLVLVVALVMRRRIA